MHYPQTSKLSQSFQIRYIFTQFYPLIFPKSPEIQHRSIATASVVLVAAFFWLQQPWMLGTALLLILAFMYQGVAVAHSRLAKKNMPTVLFVMFYLLLVMFSQFTVIVMAITGIVDNWLDMRSLRTRTTELDK